MKILNLVLLSSSLMGSFLYGGPVEVPDTGIHIKLVKHIITPEGPVFYIGKRAFSDSEVSEYSVEFHKKDRILKVEEMNSGELLDATVKLMDKLARYSSFDRHIISNFTDTINTKDLATKYMRSGISQKAKGMYKELTQQVGAFLAKHSDDADFFAMSKEITTNFPLPSYSDFMSILNVDKIKWVGGRLKKYAAEDGSPYFAWKYTRPGSREFIGSYRMINDKTLEGYLDPEDRK